MCLLYEYKLRVVCGNKQWWGRLDTVANKYLYCPDADYSKVVIVSTCSWGHVLRNVAVSHISSVPLRPLVCIDKWIRHSLGIYPSLSALSVFHAMYLRRPLTRLLRKGLIAETVLCVYVCVCNPEGANGAKFGRSHNYATATSRPAAHQANSHCASQAADAVANQRQDFAIVVLPVKYTDKHNLKERNPLCEIRILRYNVMRVRAYEGTAFYKYL